MKVKSISSSDNSYFKLFKSLTESKGLKKENLFLVSGEKLVLEFIKNNFKHIESIIYDEKNHAPISAIEARELPSYLLTPELFKQIDVLGTHKPILVVKQKTIAVWNPQESFEGLEVLCPLSDPQNLGALARSAWALGATRLVLLKEAAHPFLPKTWKASSGTIWDIPIYSGPSLHELEGKIIALDMDGEKIHNFKWPKTSRLLLGEEGLGIPKNISPVKIAIPMLNGVESLNVSVAGALAIHHYFLSTKN